MPAVFAPVSASTCTQSISGALVPANACRDRRVAVPYDAFLCLIALANEHAGRAFDFRPHSRSAAV